MPKCIRCKSDRIIAINGHTCDSFIAEYKGKEYEMYPPMGIGIGNSGDDIIMSYCLNCGQIQDKFPIKEEKVLEELDNECNEGGGENE